MSSLFIQPQSLCMMLAATDMPCVVCGKIVPPGVRLMTILGHQAVCGSCGKEADPACFAAYVRLQEVAQKRGIA